MSGAAIVMMIVAMVLVWGGLLLALINIKRSPELVDELDDPEQTQDTQPHREPSEATTTPRGAVVPEPADGVAPEPRG